MTRQRQLIALLGMLASLVIACSEDEPQAAPPTATVAPSVTPPAGGGFSLSPQPIGGLSYSNRAILDMTQGSSALDLNLESPAYGPAKVMSFAPGFIQARPGSTFTLVLRNRWPETHNFTLPSQGISVEVPTGSVIPVDVSIPTSGAALFYCKYHTQQGMNGQLLASTIAPQPLPAP